MHIVKIKGGLGNQLFQYALALQLANRYKCKLILDDSFFKKQSKRVVGLNKLQVSLYVRKKTWLCSLQIFICKLFLKIPFFSTEPSCLIVRIVFPN